MGWPMVTADLLGVNWVSRLGRKRAARGILAQNRTRGPGRRPSGVKADKRRAAASGNPERVDKRPGSWAPVGCAVGSQAAWMALWGRVLD